MSVPAVYQAIWQRRLRFPDPECKKVLSSRTVRCTGGGELSGLHETAFIDHSEKEIDYDAHYDFDYNGHVTYSAITVDAQPSLTRGLFRGTADFTLHNDSGQPQTISFWINPGYTFRSVTANGRAVLFRDLNDDSINQKTIELDIPADENID